MKPLGLGEATDRSKQISPTQENDHAKRKGPDASKRGHGMRCPFGPMKKEAVVCLPPGYNAVA